MYGRTLTSATPGKVADDGKGQYSVLVTELLNNLNSQPGAASAFNKTRISVSRASDGEQVPSVSSSLTDEIRLGGMSLRVDVPPRVQATVIARDPGATARGGAGPPAET